MRLRAFVSALLVIPLLLGTASAKEPQVATGRQGMVVTVSPPATEVGVEVLKRGGTAVDAAVAVALALCVTWPEAGNIGGGGFMMVHPGRGKEPVCIEYRETAPAAAHESMYDLRESGLGHRFVGVPGTLRGLELAHRRFGKLPWKDLVTPAVRLAAEGFAIDRPLADSLNRVLRDKETSRFGELRRVFTRSKINLRLADGEVKERTPDWLPGDRLAQKELAATLRIIADEGADAFYTGRIAEQIVAEMRAGGGLITRDDLAKYRANERRPIHGMYRGYDVYAPPPPSSGGIALVQMLNILENFDLKALGRDSADAAHLMIEAMRRAYLDRARHLGDADFVRIPEQLTKKNYAELLARETDRGRAISSEWLAKDILLAGESDSTTHFSIVDASGMAVANTYTLEQSFGSRVIVHGAGFLLNNQMGDFNRKPGHTDRTGRIGTTPNLIAPGKRMLSSQTPTILTRDGKLMLVTGSPGGRTIINTVLCVVLNRVDFGLSPRDCIAAPRLHHQWLPDVVRFEGQDRPEFKKLIADLRQRGHKIEEKLYEQGDAHSIFVDPKTGELIGVADHRRGGAAREVTR